jgi:diguanylate cyclase (GGDEF)-like protein
LSPIILSRFLPDCAGALYLFNHQKTLFESKTSWESLELKSTPIIFPDDCWSLRQGKKHVILHNDERLRCKHVDEGVKNYICEPIIAQGEMLGMLHIEFKPSDESNEDEKDHYINSRKRLIKITVDNLALSLVSLKLREVLQSQSIRDPLTHLFNRRHMEESLEREIHRCARAKSGLGIIMSDADHFKSINDKFGHDIGDFVLVEYAKLLKKSVRNSDIVCRYGGKEFIIMPDANKDAVFARAEKMCAQIREMKLIHEGMPLPELTASFGVSYADGVEVDRSELIRAADLALYKAKDGGKNQVVMSTTEFS